MGNSIVRGSHRVTADRFIIRCSYLCGFQGQLKAKVMHAFLLAGVQVLISDVDTVWLDDPLPYLERYPEADVLFSSDHLAATRLDGGLEDPTATAGSYANIGVILLRPPAANLALQLVEGLERDGKLWDQLAFNRLFRHGQKDLGREDRLFLAYNGTLLAGALPILRFCSGRVFFVQRLPQRMGRACSVIHVTSAGSTMDKRAMLRDAGLFIDPDEYYHPVNGIVSYQPDTAPGVLRAAASLVADGRIASMQPHFDLVNAQLAQFRAGHVLADVTGPRALVLPEFQCAAVRWWGPHSGLIHMGNATKPFPCPAAQILNIPRCVAAMDGIAGWRDRFGT